MSRKTPIFHPPVVLPLAQQSARYHLVIDPMLHTALEVATLGGSNVQTDRAQPRRSGQSLNNTTPLSALPL
jgi:hypothetical protein